MKTKKRKRLINVGIFSFYLLFSIQLKSQAPNSQYYIIPHAGGTTQLWNKNDFQFSIGAMELSDVSRGNNRLSQYFNALIGYSPIEHFDVKLFYSSIKQFDEGYSTQFSQKFKQAGMEIGGHYPLNIRIRKAFNGVFIDDFFRPFFFNISAGISLGKSGYNNRRGDEILGITNVDFQKIYLHGGLHCLANRLHFSYFYKIGRIKYLRGDIFGTTNSKNLDLFRDILVDNRYLFIETTFKVQYNFKKIGIGVYGQGIIGQVPAFYPSSYFIFDFGIVFKINKLKMFLKKNKRE